MTFIGPVPGRQVPLLVDNHYFVEHILSQKQALVTKGWPARNYYRPMKLTRTRETVSLYLEELQNELVFGPAVLLQSSTVGINLHSNFFAEFAIKVEVFPRWSQLIVDKIYTDEHFINQSDLRFVMGFGHFHSYPFVYIGFGLFKAPFGFEVIQSPLRLYDRFTLLHSQFGFLLGLSHRLNNEKHVRVTWCPGVDTSPVVNAGRKIIIGEIQRQDRDAQNSTPLSAHLSIIWPFNIQYRFAWNQHDVVLGAGSENKSMVRTQYLAAWWDCYASISKHLWSLQAECIWEGATELKLLSDKKPIIVNLEYANRFNILDTPLEGIVHYTHAVGAQHLNNVYTNVGFTLKHRLSNTYSVILGFNHAFKYSVQDYKLNNPDHRLEKPINKIIIQFEAD